MSKKDYVNSHQIALLVAISAIIPTHLYPQMTGIGDIFISLLAPDLLVILLVVGGLFILKTRKLYLIKSDLLLMSLVLLFSISLIWSIDPLRGVKELTYIGLFFILYLYISNSSPIAVASWVNIFLVFSVINGTLALSFLALEGSLRGAGLGSWPNHYSAYAEASLPFVIISLRNYTGIKKFVPAGIILLNIVIIVISMSRGGFLTLLLIGSLFFTIYVINFNSNISVNYLKLGTIALMISFAIFLFDLSVGQGFFDSYLSRLSTISLETSTEQLKSNLGEARYIMYTVALETISSNPLFGSGLGSFPSIVAQHYRVGLIVHNIFLKSFVSAGIGAFLLLTYCIISLYQAALSTLQSGDFTSDRLILAAVISFTSIIFHGLFRPVLTSNPFFYIVAGIITMYYKST